MQGLCIFSGRSARKGVSSVAKNARVLGWAVRVVGIEARAFWAEVLGDVEVRVKTGAPVRMAGGGEGYEVDQDAIPWPVLERLIMLSAKRAGLDESRAWALLHAGIFIRAEDARVVVALATDEQPPLFGGGPVRGWPD
jgi:hypothetical protein